MSEVVKVGIADMNIVHSPNTIRTTGLGSCVGVIIYDPFLAIAGLVHVMLPDSGIAKAQKEINKAKFADTAIKELTERLIKNGCKKLHLKAKIAGGAEMFSFSSSNDFMKIGPRNVEAVKNALKSEGIELLSEETGGNSGRTIEFDPNTFLLQIKSVNQGIRFI
ncbi:chemotaxis protein CheD [Heyndrickxia shackletonii]|uniref:Probable chemoreceptor glutamine deamidase CheD n=1 Tax=Heyndrickxia shackletonii TaxID=157838 RepID=A0A0Q3WZ62_9BACI|nr:chemotaxis protein CheD [Heyndrickxia shackletonii]KQL54611.1 chemotaxis protein CheD [Heyndrickxia shackletonii]MBB2478645.1 chemotaxis protein CheD [Bacillus sp. APMAM]NEY98256.1 chemotaxis protein CheD [Heyndrickxia shackletonii]RTZ57788.1 chemotaxis protein CheD [Bacillus sp. SAJ1]